MGHEKLLYTGIGTCVLLSMILTASAYSDEEDTRNILKQGLLGAGVGAIAAGTSKGNAGQGALVGAGTAVIGSALLDAITEPPSRSRSRRAAEPPPDEGYYYPADEPEDYYYEEEPQESSSQKILKQGLVGAGTGAIAAGVSGGDAGKGALIGAGTNVIGNALLDTLTEPPRTRRGRAYRRIPPRQTQNQYTTQESADASGTGDQGTRKKIIKKYDESGKLVSEEEIYY